MSALHSREHSKVAANIESNMQPMDLEASHAASNFYGISQHPSSRQNRQQDKENQQKAAFLQQQLQPGSRFQKTQVQVINQGQNQTNQPNQPLNQGLNQNNTSEYVSLQHAAAQNQPLINQTSRSTNITNYDSVQSRSQYHVPNTNYQQIQQLPSNTTRNSSIYIPNQENNNPNVSPPNANNSSSKQTQLTYEIYRLHREQVRGIRGLRACVKYIVCLLILLNILVGGLIVAYFLRDDK